jgi:pimeloyl-ACP methyl ester carboxylesterase
MDRRDFLKTLAAAGAMLTVKSNGVMDIMASTLPGAATAQAAADNYADMAAIMNGEPAAMLRAALEQMGGIKRFVKKGDKVTLKPNIGWDRTPELAANTNPDLIVEMIKQCQSAGAAEVKVFDHTCDEWTRCYDHSGIDKAVKAAGGIMVPANEESYYQEIELPKGKALKKAKVPVIFFHGEDDSLVPCWMSKACYEACASRKRLVTIPGAEHGLSFPTDPERYLKEVREFFGPEASYKA